MTAQQTDRVQNAVNQHMTPYLGIQHVRAVSYDAVGSIVRYAVAPNFGYDHGYAADLAALNGSRGTGGARPAAAPASSGTDRALSQRARADWTSVQNDAGKIKSEVDGGNVDSALIEATGIASGQLGQDFYALDAHLGQAADTQLTAFQADLAAARSGESGWGAVPAVLFGAVMALTLAGVRRRLADTADASAAGQGSSPPRPSPNDKDSYTDQSGCERRSAGTDIASFRGRTAMITAIVSAIIAAAAAGQQASAPRCGP